MDPTLRRKITFSDHSLATDNVFSEVHLVICRNVLIYFDHALQTRALKLFAESLIRADFWDWLEREPAFQRGGGPVPRVLHARAHLPEKGGGAVTRRIELVVIGGSAGAFDVLRDVLRQLTARFAPAMAIVVHLPPTGPNLLPEVFSNPFGPRMKLAEDKEPIAGGTIYFAAPTTICWSGPITPLPCPRTIRCISPARPSTCCSSRPQRPMVQV
jgi:hypothetical protein